MGPTCLAAKRLICAKRAWPGRLTAGLIGTVVPLLVLSSDAASAQGLRVSVGDRLGETTTLVAARRVNLVATVHLPYSETGCTAGELGQATAVTASVNLPPEAALQDGLPASQTIPLPSNLEQFVAGTRQTPNVVNIRWPLVISRPGVYHGSVLVTARSPNGRDCSGTQDFAILAVTNGPTFQVLGGLLARNRVIVAVKAVLPGATRGGLSERELGEAFDDAIGEAHDSRGGVDSGRGVLDLLSVRQGRRRLQVEKGSNFGGGPERASCLEFPLPRRLAHTRLSYRLRFDWNGEKGFPARTKSGRLRVTGRFARRVARACAGVPPH